MDTAITFLLLLLASPAALAATNHTVGGSSGWSFNVNYDTWASGETFAPGDSLVFNYASPPHAVTEVSESDYQNCNSGSPINSYSTSPTTIPLTADATRYFICPTPTHCTRGMKVAVTVTAASTGSPPPAGGSTPSPPAGGSTPSPPAGGSTPSPPAGGSTPSPPAGGSTPSPPSGSPATPGNGPSTTTPSPPPPPSGSASATTAAGLVAGTSVVLAALFGLMG